MSSSPPAVVADRYRLVAPLGQGGMGRVWRATDVVLHREVAIKELVPPPGLTPGERQEMRERSLREARAIARLNNINVVRVFDVLSTDADPWIVMEYVPSRSLQDILAADGPFSPVRTAEIGLGVLGALRAAHRAGVVHRDVKPGNVLIGADGRVVLTDFGLATVPGDPNVTRTGLVLGSPAYIAPERARDGTAGPAADLWSLGATLYAAVEGASPFARPSAIATLAALATENPPPARNAGPLKPVLNGLLRKDPTHRINAEEAERLLNRAAGRRSKLSFPMSPTMRRPGVGRERPALGGMMSSTSSAPVVPGPRPPIAPARPVDPPGRPPVSGGRRGAGAGRPRVFGPGKARVGRPTADTPTKADGPKLDATRLDTPPVKDDKTTFMGTRDGSTTAGAQPPASRQASPAAAPANPSTRTNRGEPGGFTAADVAAHRRRKAAPEHEQSLSDATALLRAPVVPPADPTTVVPPPPPADATTLLASPSTDATTVVPPAKTSKRTPAKRAGQPPATKATPAAPSKANDEKLTPASAAASSLADAPLKPTEASASSADARTSPAQAAPASPTESEGATESATKTATPDQGAVPSGTAETDAAKAGSAGADAATAGAAGVGAADGGAADGGARRAGTAQSDAVRVGATDAGGTDADAGTAGTAEVGTAQGDVATADGTEAGAAAASAAKANATEAGATEANATEAGAAEANATEAGAAEADAARIGSAEAGAASADAAKAGSAEAGAVRTDSAKARAAKAGAAGAGGAKAAGGKAGDKKAAARTADAANADDVDALKAGAAAESGGTAAEAPLPRTSAKPGGKRAAGGRTTGKPANQPEAAAATSKISSADEKPADEDNAPVSPVPSINRSSRPAWRPMEPRPAPGGVTVFGTRLTYRQAAVGAGIVLLVLALVITLVAQAVGSDDDKTGGTKPNAGGTPAATQPTQPATAATTPSPTPTSAAPTTTAPSSAPAADPGAVTLPKGWTMRTFGASGSAPGFKIPLPANADVSGGGTEYRFKWNNRLLIFGRTKSPQADAYVDWQNQEKARRGTYRDYHLLGLDRVTYRNYESAADWEFTYTTDSGNPQHVIRRNVRVNGSAAYSLNWYVSTSDWDASQADLKLLYQGFQPQ